MPLLKGAHLKEGKRLRQMRQPPWQLTSPSSYSETLRPMMVSWSIKSQLHTKLSDPRHRPGPMLWLQCEYGWLWTFLGGPLRGYSRLTSTSIEYTMKRREKNVVVSQASFNSRTKPSIPPCQYSLSTLVKI